MAHRSNQAHCLFLYSPPAKICQMVRGGDGSGGDGGGNQIKNNILGASLVVQWLRIRLPMQGTWVRALVREDPTCHGATKPVLHNY